MVTPALLRSTAVCMLRLLVACGVGTFAFFCFATPTTWYVVRAAVEWKNGLVLDYTFGNGTYKTTTPLLTGGVSFMVCQQWAGP